MPNLHGFLVVAKDVPSFAIPVLIDRPGSNLPLIQQIDINNRIASFFEVDVGNNYEDTHFKFELNIGDEALWAFRLLWGDTICGNFDSLKAELADRLSANQFTNFPLIETQIAKFCELTSSYASALAKSYELIQRRSKLAAAIWRDCSVLLPLARKDLAQSLPKHLSSELDNVRLVGSGNTILLELPRNVHDFVSSRVTELKLTDTLGIGYAFGLTDYALRDIGVRENSFKSKFTFDEPYGELVPFTGIGNMVAKNSPSHTRTRILTPPWIDKNRRPTATSPLVRFCVINTDIEKIDHALRFVAGRAEKTINIAIVTSPITFGTSRGHKLNPRLLHSLRPTFDYVFVIGNHVIQMPTGAAPRLAASSRAVKYVRACVDGVMQLIWSSGAPRTPKEFFAIFPRDGFGLVGRAFGTRESAPKEILQEAIESALNERLSLSRSKRLIAVGPASIVNDGRVLSFLDQAADAALNEALSVVSTSRRAAVTLLGFGIKLLAQTEPGHRLFCLELLHTRKFSIVREAETFIQGKFINGNTVAIGFSASEQSLEHMCAVIDRTANKIRCVLTNFALNASDIEHYWNRRIAVFHYTLLDTYLKEGMSLPPLRRWR